uniref:Uncharacterized protein n=1 Tax=Ananas comosus var. bracteatus TaxID=296719 RepID=A0A6V7NJE3_ANACO|nr:unnamed protein product [Ananas comosus var. bracteatus]
MGFSQQIASREVERRKKAADTRRQEDLGGVISKEEGRPCLDRGISGDNESYPHYSAKRDEIWPGYFIPVKSCYSRLSRNSKGFAIPPFWWNSDVKAAVSGFGELWNIDLLSDSRMDVSFFRAYIRCQHVQNIPEVINLMVEDRRFKESFIHLTGFSSVPARQPLEQHRHSDVSSSFGERRCGPDYQWSVRRGKRVQGEFSNSNSNSPCPVPDTQAPPILSGHFVVFGCTPLLLPAPAPAPGSKPTPYALEGPPNSHRKGKAAMDLLCLGSTCPRPLGDGKDATDLHCLGSTCLGPLGEAHGVASPSIPLDSALPMESPFSHQSPALGPN